MHSGEWIFSDKVYSLLLSLCPCEFRSCFVLLEGRDPDPVYSRERGLFAVISNFNGTPEHQQENYFPKRRDLKTHKSQAWRCRGG
jgi:hypothetical protein